MRKTLELYSEKKKRARASSWVSVAYSKLGPSTMASTGHASWHSPQKMHLVMSMSYRVVLRLPSSRSSASMVMACAGHTASHSLHAMQRSSPVA